MLIKAKIYIFFHLQNLARRFRTNNAVKSEEEEKHVVSMGVRFVTCNVECFRFTYFLRGFTLRLPAEDCQKLLVANGKILTNDKIT